MPKLKSRKPVKFAVNLSLPKNIVNDLDVLAKDLDTSRDEIIQEITEYVMRDEDWIEDIFGDDEDDEED